MTALPSPSPAAGTPEAPAAVDPPTAEGYVAGAGLAPQEWHEVAAPPEELAAAAGRLVDATGAGAGELDLEQLARLVRDIADVPALWEPLVVEDRERRRYRLLYEDDRIDVWVLSWMPGQQTGYHDHARSGVALTAARGMVVERQLLLPSGASRVELAGDIVRTGPGGYIHAVGHGSGAPAVTIHAYSPPLLEVGQYRANEAGILQREVQHGRQELLDHSIATVAPELAEASVALPLTR